MKVRDKMKNKYLTEKERCYIEFALQRGDSKQAIADHLGKCLKTIYNEIKRGTVELLDCHLKTYSKYCADVGQRITTARCASKGRALNIGNNFALADFLKKSIVEDKYSPYCALELAKQRGFEPNFCLSTLYSYIHKHIFKDIRSKDLPNKGKHCKANKKRVYSYRMGNKPLIEEREDLSKRSDFGHWEFDTVYSCRGDKSVLFVLTERKYRIELIGKYFGRTEKNCIAFLDKIEGVLGVERFKGVFKTITCDNGVEFSNYRAMEQSTYCSSARTKVFFCHPYSSFERGSNENANKLIRRFIPKRALIRDFKKSVKIIQDYINNLPRKLFNGLSSIQALKMCEPAYWNMIKSLIE